jgi:hypothetical protein
MTTFDASKHPRVPDGRFAKKAVEEAPGTTAALTITGELSTVEDVLVAVEGFDAYPARTMAPEKIAGSCRRVSSDFQCWARENTDLDVETWDFFDDDGEIHTANVVDDGHKLTIIDWTARQYDTDADVPTITPFDEDYLSALRSS